MVYIVAGRHQDSSSWPLNPTTLLVAKECHDQDDGSHEEHRADTNCVNFVRVGPLGYEPQVTAYRGDPLPYGCCSRMYHVTRSHRTPQPETMARRARMCQLSISATLVTMVYCSIYLVWLLVPVWLARKGHVNINPDTIQVYT